MATSADQTPSRRRVLMPIDAGSHAEYAFKWYLKAVHKRENHLILLHVPEILDAERNRMLYLTASAWEEAVQKEHAHIKELEEKYSTKITRNGIDGLVRTEPGNKPGELICKVAEDEKVTMIVMGTRGLGKVRRTIMGSVSDYVVKHASCPVIVCRQ